MDVAENPLKDEWQVKNCVMMLRTKMIRRLGVVILLWIGSVSIAHTQPSGFMVIIE